MHWLIGQRVKGQDHTVTKTVTVAWLQGDACCSGLCWRGYGTHIKSIRLPMFSIFLRQRIISSDLWKSHKSLFWSLGSPDPPKLLGQLCRCIHSDFPTPLGWEVSQPKLQQHPPWKKTDGPKKKSTKAGQTDKTNDRNKNLRQWDWHISTHADPTSTRRAILRTNP